MATSNSYEVRAGLPAQAKCVFKGIIFEVWQWEQEMFDGTKQVFEKIWRCPTVEVVATLGDKVVILEQDQPDRKNFISLPSGRADGGEEPLEEAKRELLEETGYVSSDWAVLLRHDMGGKVLHDVYYFTAKHIEYLQETDLDAGERISMRLVSFDEFIDLADEERFWVSPQFQNLLLHAKFDEKIKKELRSKIF